MAPSAQLAVRPGFYRGESVGLGRAELALKKRWQEPRLVSRRAQLAPPFATFARAAGGPARIVSTRSAGTGRGPAQSRAGKHTHAGGPVPSLSAHVFLNQLRPGPRGPNFYRPNHFERARS